MKKDLLDRLANYLITGVIFLTVILLIGYTINNFRVVVNMILIFFGLIFLGFCVYEGMSYIYKKIKNDRKNNK